MSSVPSTPLHLLSTEQIQQCLNENRNLMREIDASWSTGKVVKCVEYETILQKNLEYLKKVAYAKCQFYYRPVAPQQNRRIMQTVPQQASSSWPPKLNVVRPQSQQKPMLPLPSAVQPHDQQNPTPQFKRYQMIEFTRQQQDLAVHRQNRHDEMLKFQEQQQVPLEKENLMLEFQQYRQSLYEQYQKQQLVGGHSGDGSSGSSNAGSQAAAFDSISGGGHGKSGGIKD